jgi:putative addiction module CopG family antidote
MDHVVLPPDLQRFAAEAVAAGRYRDISELVAAGIAMLRRTEDARARLLESVQAAERDGETNGFLTLDELMADASAVIAEMAGQVR